MSGVFKAVGKTFKAVVKVVKKVAPVILAAAAIYFTAGAVLAGGAGWAAMAGSFASGTLGLTGTMASIVGGAITYAGYGAAAGAAMSAITGKNVMKGMQQGALVGAISGGIAGAAGLYQVPASVTGEGLTSSAQATQEVAAGTERAAAAESAAASATDAGQAVTGGVENGFGVGTAAGDTAAASMTAATAGAPAAAPVTAYGLGGVTSGAPGAAGAGGTPTATASKGFFDNPIVAGGLVAGIGQGVGNFAAAKAEGAAQEQAAARTSANYTSPGGPGGLMTTTSPGGKPYDPASVLNPENQAGHYVVDPGSGQVIFVRNPANLVANPQGSGPTV